MRKITHYLSETHPHLIEQWHPTKTRYNKFKIESD